MKHNELKKKLAFASADIFGGGSFNIVNFLYPGFLAITVGISPYWIGVVILVARIWDAITDPLMGHISDRTKSKMGKRRIYLMFAAPFVLLSMFLLFFPYSFSSTGLRVVAVLLSYLIFTTVQTSVMIPYYSLSSEITSDYQKRASYNSYRLGFSIFSSILCVAVPGIIVGMFGDRAIGFQVMSLSFGLLFALSVLFTGLFAREEIQTPIVETKLSFKGMAKPLGLRPFRQYLGMFLVLQMSMAIMSGLFFFYVDFFVTKSETALGNPTMVGLISAALMFSMQIVALPVYLKMIEKKGKTFAYRFGAFLWIITALFILVIPANVNPIMIYLLAAVMGFGISGPGLVPHTMYGDVVDAGQIKFKDRLDGQMSGFTNFINKIAQAVGLALVMFLIGLAGFQEQPLNGPAIVGQPDSALLMIRIIMSLAPLIFMSIGIYISYQYKIDAKKQKEITDAIQDLTISREEIILGL
ncbi:MFS transporter [Peloplasma aerotolerans]|jgi:oligogalacturonide transporter|uniref:MFS transporter n=1 Tax=Peloplasma aerotolerans TaxID=3044389 RepID=A0AAW6U7P4_9MOLU|nr:MFS transporter [Mariniplasma sp. M4Ah]MDI6452795.1 MFS transporter [Mariniplasma sp. M4Ah]